MRSATVRSAIFGDLIDRDPEEELTVSIARSIVNAGSAKIVARNHGFNAIAYATADPASPGQHRFRCQVTVLCRVELRRELGVRGCHVVLSCRLSRHRRTSSVRE
jgi:hypothetical protein